MAAKEKNDLIAERMVVVEVVEVAAQETFEIFAAVEVVIAYVCIEEIDETTPTAELSLVDVVIVEKADGKTPNAESGIVAQQTGEKHLNLVVLAEKVGDKTRGVELDLVAVEVAE